MLIRSFCQLLDHWETLPLAYRIPKRAKQVYIVRCLSVFLLLSLCFKQDVEDDVVTVLSNSGPVYADIPSPTTNSWEHGGTWSGWLGDEMPARKRQRFFVRAYRDYVTPPPASPPKSPEPRPPPVHKPTRSDIKRVIANAAAEAEAREAAVAAAAAAAKLAPPEKSSVRKKPRPPKKVLTSEEKETNKEKRLLKLVGAVVVKCMSKYSKSMDTDLFKKHAKEVGTYFIYGRLWPTFCMVFLSA